MHGGVVAARLGAHRKVDRSRRCSPMCCSTKWLENWKGAVTALSAMPMTAMYA